MFFFNKPALSFLNYKENIFFRRNNYLFQCYLYFIRYYICSVYDTAKHSILQLTIIETYFSLPVEAETAQTTEDTEQQQNQQQQEQQQQQQEQEQTPAETGDATDSPAYAPSAEPSEGEIPTTPAPPASRQSEYEEDFSET